MTDTARSWVAEALGLSFTASVLCVSGMWTPLELVHTRVLEPVVCPARVLLWRSDPGPALTELPWWCLETSQRGKGWESQE